MSMEAHGSIPSVESARERRASIYYAREPSFPLFVVALTTLLTDIRLHIVAPPLGFVARFGEVDRITTLPFLHSSAISAGGTRRGGREGGRGRILLLAVCPR